MMNDKKLARELAINVAREDVHRASDRIGQFARIIGLGLAGFAYLIISSDSRFSHQLVADHHQNVLVISISGVFVLFFDWTQNLFAYFQAIKASRRAQENLDPYGRSLLFTIRQGCFYGKQLAAIIGVGSFGALLAKIF